MKLTINSKFLLTALNLCKGGIKEATTTPKTRYFKFDAANNILNISACNSEVSLQTSLPCECESLQILIPADKLFELLPKLPSQLIDIYLDNEQVYIKAVSGIYDFPGDETEGFLEIKTISENSVTISADDLQAAIYSSEFARSNDEIQGAFIGLSVDFAADKATFTACNLLLLSTYSFAGIFTPGQILLPQTIVNTLKGISQSGEVTVNYSVNSVSFEYANLTIKSLLMGEKYANWRGIIPKNETEITIDRQSLIGAIGRVLAFSAKKSKQIYLSFGIGSVTIYGKDEGLKQSGSETLVCTCDAEANISLNGEMILATLTHLGSNDIQLLYGGFNIALIVKEPGEKDNFAMVMPLME